MSSFQVIMKSTSKNKKYINPFNFNNIIKSEKYSLKKDDKSSLYSINSETIEKIIMKYVLNNKTYINNLIDVNIITTYIYNSKKLQNFIHLNELTIHDFMKIVLDSKIVTGHNGNCIYKQGDEFKGFFALLKGNLKVKVSKNTCVLDINKEYQEEILKEYNLDISEVSWIDNNNNNENFNDNNLKKYNQLLNYNNNNISEFEINLKAKRNSLRTNLMTFSRKSLTNINTEFSKERDLFTYNCKNNLYYDNNNETIIFGGIHLFNDYMIDSTQIHLSSAYCYSNKDESNNINNNCKMKIKYDTILLYFREDSLREMTEKIIMNNKKRIVFLSKRLIPISNMSSFECTPFISNIKLIYIHVNEKKDIKINNNTFHLIYKGQCNYTDNIKENIIYDEGDFLFLNNIFENNNNNNEKIMTLYTKTSNTILFQIDLSILSDDHLFVMKKFLWNIYNNQNKIRLNYHINKLKYRLNLNNSRQNNGERKKYFLLCSNNIFKFNSCQKINNKNIKKINKTYFFNNNKSSSSFLINSFDKNINNNNMYKNNSSSSLCRFRIPKKRNKKLKSEDNFNQISNFQNESFSKIKQTNNKNNSFKYISTKNSTNSKTDIKLNNHTSKFLFNQSTKINEFNDNIFPSEIEKIDKRKKDIKFLSNLGSNGNSILSLILTKNNNNINGRNKNTYKESFDEYQKKSKSLIKNTFNKNIFFNNINQSINILKYIYQKDYTKKTIKSHNKQFLQKNRKISGFMYDKIIKYVNNIKSNKNINISI